MPRSRDRHGRGIRGPLALPGAWTPKAAPLNRTSRTEYFNDCLTAAVADIAEVNPDALRDVLIGVEEVPHFNVNWSGERVPMSAALEPDRDQRAQIVIYERPHEHRARTRSELRRLVHRTIVEQLSTLTGIPQQELTNVDTDTWDD